MVSGFITKLHVDEGSVVRKGQVLFSIDPVQYQAAVNSAKAAVETAKAAVNTQELTVSNKRTLNQKNIISDYDLQMAENQLATIGTGGSATGQCSKQPVIHQCNKPQRWYCRYYPLSCR